MLMVQIAIDLFWQDLSCTRYRILHIISSKFINEGMFLGDRPQLDFLKPLNIQMVL